ncbi:MAG: BACON domain-containing protein [Prevotella sp.]|nr:BACON domain-containing protein [Prevotella sp.]
MKTRKYISIVAALLLTAAFTGCKSEDETTAKPAKERLMVVGGTEVTFKANEEGPATDVNISADCRWTVTVDHGTFDENNFSVSPHQGNGNGSLVISANKNTSANETRTATITLTSDGGLKQVISVKQTAGDDALNISTSQIEFGAEDTDKKPLDVSSNVSWTIAPAPGYDWIHIYDRDNNTFSGNGSSGSTALYIGVDNTRSDAERTGYIDLTYSGQTIRIEVVQQGMTNVTLNVPTDDVRWSFNPNESTIQVRSNADWQAFIPSGATWLRFTDSRATGNGHNLTGSGDAEIHIACDENNTSRDRMSAVVIIAGTKNPQQAAVVVEQVGNSSQQPLETSIGLTNIAILRESATFLLNIVSEIEVGEFGLIYSTRNDSLSLDNGQTVKLGQGGLSQGAVGELTNLEKGTTYYVRAYLKKITNGETLYSDVVSITTLTAETSVSELRSIYVANDYADFRYSFVADEEVGDYGLVYSASNSVPTISDEVLTVNRGGLSRGVLGTIKDLKETTTYYVRAFVVSSAGQYVYSPNVVTITTSSSISEPGQSDNPDPQFSRRK